MFGLTLTICFITLEYGIGSYYSSNDNQVSDKIFDSKLGWRLRPGTYWAKPGHTFKKHSIYINKFGLRNKNIADTPKKGTKRILILGDSFTFAWTSQNKEMFSSQLETLINDSNLNNYEVINAGVSGYGTAQELLFMKGLADKNVVGDIYLLMIYINDILDNLRLSYDDLSESNTQPGFNLDSHGKMKLKFQPKREYSTNFVPLSRPKTFIAPQVFKRRIEMYLQTKPAAVKLLNRIGIHANMHRIPGLLNGWYRQEVLDDGIPLMKALISEIRNEALKRDAKLLICLIPSPLQVYPDVYNSILEKSISNTQLVENYLNDATRPQRAIGEISSELNIPYLDLYPILYKNNDKVLYTPADGHFSKTGHAIVAKSLAQFILANNTHISIKSK